MLNCHVKCPEAAIVAQDRRENAFKVEHHYQPTAAPERESGIKPVENFKLNTYFFFSLSACLRVHQFIVKSKIVILLSK